MKKLILVFVAIAITAGAYAQAGSTNGKTGTQDVKNKQNQTVPNNPQDLNKNQNQNMQNNPQDLNKNQNQNGLNNSQDLNKNQNQNMQNNPVDKTRTDGVMMKNGKMMQVKNGQSSSLDNDVTLSNGTKISSDGTCTKKDGTKTTLKDGQHMDMSGNMTSSTDKDNNMYLVPDSTKKKSY